MWMYAKWLKKTKDVPHIVQVCDLFTRCDAIDAPSKSLVDSSTSADEDAAAIYAQYGGTTNPEGRLSKPLVRAVEI